MHLTPTFYLFLWKFILGVYTLEEKAGLHLDHEANKREHKHRQSFISFFFYQLTEFGCLSTE
jgi:hypothetical protein